MRRLSIFIAAATIAAGAWAGEGTTGAASLKLGVGARGQAMGDAFSARADGVEALFWNPAGLATGAQRSLMLGFQPMLDDATIGQAAVAGRFGRVAAGFGFNALKHDKLDGFDDAGNGTGSFQAGDQTILAGVATGNDRFAAGLTAKFWSSTIDGESASTFAGDLGLSFASPFSRRMRHSLVGRHIGGKVSYIDQQDPLPTTVVFGNAYNPNKRLGLDLDAAWEQGAGSYFSGGAEWAAVRASGLLFQLRGGYTTRRNDANGLSGASVGFGVALRTLSFDYAWVPFGDLGDSHAITLIWRPSREPIDLRRRGEPKQATRTLKASKGKIESRPSGRKQLNDLAPPRPK